MKKLKTLILVWCCVGVSYIFAQDQNSFISCSAAFLDNKMLVDEYTTKGKATLAKNAVGKLIVAEAELLDNNQANIIQQIEFMVAIRDQNSQTLMMFSSEVYREIKIEQILAKCRKGDRIVLLTMKDKYALPHNEILVL